MVGATAGAPEGAGAGAVRTDDPVLANASKPVSFGFTAITSCG